MAEVGYRGAKCIENKIKKKYEKAEWGMHRREGVRKSQKGWNGRLQSVQEFITGDMEGVGYSINPILCK